MLPSLATPHLPPSSHQHDYPTQAQARRAPIALTQHNTCHQPLHKTPPSPPLALTATSTRPPRANGKCSHSPVVAGRVQHPLRPKVPLLRPPALTSTTPFPPTNCPLLLWSAWLSRTPGHFRLLPIPPCLGRRDALTSLAPLGTPPVPLLRAPPPTIPQCTFHPPTSLASRKLSPAGITPLSQPPAPSTPPWASA